MARRTVRSLSPSRSPISRLESPSTFSPRISRRSCGEQVLEPAECLVGLGDLAGGVLIGDELPGARPAERQRFLPTHVLLPAGGAAVLVDDLVLRHLGEERDEVTRVLEPLRARAESHEEARPDALEEVQRVEPRPQQPGELPPHHEADLGLVSGEQLARGQFVPGPDAVEERPKLAPAGLLPVMVRVAGRIARGHWRFLLRAGGAGRSDHRVMRTFCPETSCHIVFSYINDVDYRASSPLAAVAAQGRETARRTATARSGA